MRVRSVRMAPLLLGGILFFGACASANASSDSDKAVCDTVTHDLDQAKNDVSSAEKDADSSRGTPGEKDASDKAKVAQAKVDKLTERKAECDQKATTTTTGSTSTTIKATTTTTTRVLKGGDTGKTSVTDADGTVKILPIIEDGTTVVGDSTSDPRTPASLRQEKENGPLKDWKDAFERLGKFDYYVKGVNDRKSVTGFDWNDVKRFANTKNVESRAIIVYNWTGKTDKEARDDVRKLVGNDADKLVIHRIDSCVVNTRGFLDRQGMEDFTDCRQMVRVSLLPIIYDKDGKPAGLSAKSGIFIDCFNLWRLPLKVERPTRPGKSTPHKTPHQRCVPPTVSYGGRCVKPASDDGHGGNQSKASQPVQEHKQPPTKGASAPPPPPVRSNSGDGGTGPATGPVDNSHSGDSTSVDTPVCDPNTGAGCS